ncbi:hypothetical protein GIB67_038598 [Kingdonia uniflora]|uniref:FHA domain-containing protein n=1 Tax=Kingdonia uniflora TaxID=39325 RepID=A0A7J7NPI9_9MAGN|nr:hypothetical protein GIB67_038598 [Kingdonia uniflora]
MKVHMGPPPSKPLNPSEPLDTISPSQTLIEPDINTTDIALLEENETLVLEPCSSMIEPPSIKVPYTIPQWSEAPCHPFYLEVLKDGAIIDQLHVSEKGAYMFGRVDLCDLVLEHPTISRFHAVLQFKQSGEAYLYDLGSTHGTSINKNQVKKKVYAELHVGDVIRFGQSSRLYIFQGPSELMPPEKDLKKIRSSKVLEEIKDREASLLRAKMEASLADGISWGMGEDAIEEAEEDAEEVTWQIYKGQLTEKQEKTREKIIKRTEKIANMKKEIDAIRAKDISQGGLTQGQQTQIARNEQRMSQILEELESLEETLNESIQESLGARTGKIRGNKKGTIVDEDEVTSDEDEFYDRTKKSTHQKVDEDQSIETTDTLLEKKDAIIKKMENTKNLIMNEKSRNVQQIKEETEGGDPLDAYMTGLSSQLVLDTTTQLEKELSSLLSELDRILYLLKIADPTGEASKKRDSKEQASVCSQPDLSHTKQVLMKQKKSSNSEKVKKDPAIKVGAPDASACLTKPSEADKNVIEALESKTRVYTLTKPQWLGAVDDIKMGEIRKEAPLDMQDSDQFVDYKDRDKALRSIDEAQLKVESIIEDAAPGLIIRKRKQVQKAGGSGEANPELSTSSATENGTTAADAVALLLKHKRGYLASEEDDEQNRSLDDERSSVKENSKSRRKLGPDRPDFLNGTDYEAWVPPKGQSGDGRTSLNDRLGY